MNITIESNSNVCVWSDCAYHERLLIGKKYTYSKRAFKNDYYCCASWGHNILWGTKTNIATQSKSNNAIVSALS